MTSAVEIRDLSKSFGTQQVLRGLDLTIEGGVVALLGPNGAGKSTLVAILTTILRPDGGSARVLGHDVVSDASAVRSLLRLTSQSPSLDELLSGRENLVLLGQLLGLSPRASKSRAEELLGRLDLASAGRKPVRAYSGGMRRRLDLAASLIAPAPLLILDEPTTGLDPTSRDTVWEDVQALARTGTTVLLTTQTLNEAEALADRITLLHHGRIAADGTVAELTSLVGSQEVVLVDSAGQTVARFETDGSPASVAHALASAPTPPHGTEIHVELRSPDLEDVFAALTAQTQELPA